MADVTGKLSGNLWRFIQNGHELLRRGENKQSPLFANLCAIFVTVCYCKAEIGF